MLINESVYGLENDWINAPLAGANNGDWQFGKVANFGSGNHTLQSGNTAGKTPINNHIDRSLSWCALGSESNYCNLTIYDKDGNTTTHRTDENLNFFFWQRYNINSVGQLQSNVVRNNADNMLWSPISNFGTNSTHRYITPFTNLYINKIVWVIYVKAATDTTLASIYTYTYADYTANHKVDHPVIIQIYAEPYVYRTVSDNRQNYNSTSSISSHPNTVITLGLFTEFDLPNTGGNSCIDYACFDGDRTTNLLLFGKRNESDNLSNAMYKYIIAVGNVKTNGNNAALKVYQDDNIDAVLENALKTIACFGFYFVFDSAYVNDALDSNNVYMGVIPENGVSHGEYTHGAANRENPNWNWNGTNDSTYDYTKPVDPTHYDKTTVFGSNSLYNTFIQYYALSPAQVTNLCGQIYTYVNSLDPANVDINQSIVKTFYTNNPLDCVVSLKKFPFNIVDYFDPNSVIPPVNVKLGNLVTGAVGWKLNGTYTVVDFGQYDFFPHFGNTFLDYSPYTYAELIIPFCGSVRLDMAYFMGHKLKLKMVVDVYTGACTCYILADNLCIDSVSGNCAIDVPISGIQSADFQNSVQNAITNVKNAKINAKAIKTQSGFSTSLMQSGLNLLQDLGVKKAEKAAYTAGQFTNLSSFLNIGSTISNAGKTYDMTKVALEQANYDLKHIETPFNSVGSQSAANSYVEEMQARLIIYRPKFIDGYDATVYGKTEGFACMKTTTVNACSGLTSGNINLSGVTTTNGKALTEEEKAMIISAFAKGVIL